MLLEYTVECRDAFKACLIGDLRHIEGGIVEQRLSLLDPLQIQIIHEAVMGGLFEESGKVAGAEADVPCHCVQRNIP